MHPVTRSFPNLTTSLRALLAVAVLPLFVATSAHAAVAKVKLNDVKSAGLFFRTADPNVFLAAPTLSTDVDIRVTGLIARATVKQSFVNSGSDWLAAVYAFPLPENAAVDTLKLRIGDRVIEGVIKEKAEAKRIFEQAKREGRKAALVEQLRPNLFTNSVANIAPGERVVVEIAYQQTLRYDQGQVSMRYPMAITPRYGAEDVAETSTSDVSAATPNPTRLHVSLDAGFALGGVDAPHHDVKIRRAGNTADLVLADAPNLPDRDFVLQWTPMPFSDPQVAGYRSAHDGHDYALFMLMPPTETGADTARPAKEQTLIIDTSGSMEGASMEQAKVALGSAISKLRAGDTFNLIEFNSTARTLFDAPRSVTKGSIEQARAFIRGLEANGGTEMEPALKLAFAQPRPLGDRRGEIIFITDGAIAQEDTLFRLISDELGDRRLFTVGIGSAPNTYFMKKAAQFGRGTFTFIGAPTEVREKMGNLFAKLEAPAVKDISLHVDGENLEMWPQEISDLYVGEPIVVAVRGDRVGNTLTVKGKRAGRSFQRVMHMGARQQAGVEQLWARRKIESLLDVERTGERPVREEVVQVALAHHLVSKYTSLVAVDVTKTRPDAAKLRTDAMSAPPPGSLPSGGTEADLMMLIGMFLLAAAAFVARRQRGAFAHAKRHA